MFKFTVGEAQFISLCIEWFLYGKISVLCALNCTVTLAKEVQLFPGLGLYSGIFAIYLQCPKKESRSAMFIFYVLCLLYFLSTATVVGDLLGAILAIHVAVSNNSIRSLKNTFFFISYAGCTITSAWSWHAENVFSPFVCQGRSNWLLWSHRPIYLGTHKHYHPFYPPKSPKIYRCWIMWGKNIYIVIIPSFLAITYIGQSISLHLINRFRFIPSTSFLGSCRSPT